MPSTVIRSSQKTGLVLLESRVSVGSDGLVTIDASFLAPSGGLGANEFALDSGWPSRFPLPPSTPGLQAAPSLLTQNASKQNGLTIVQAQYVSATNPVRVAISESTEKLTFSGYAEQSGVSAIGTASASGSLSFDYYTTAQTATYTLIAPNAFNFKPVGRIGRSFNVRKEGFSDLVTTQEVETLTSSSETLGRVSRVSVTARRIIEQGNVPPIEFSPFGGATVNGVPLNNPWGGPNIFGQRIG